MKQALSNEAWQSPHETKPMDLDSKTSTSEWTRPILIDGLLNWVVFLFPNAKKAENKGCLYRQERDTDGVCHSMSKLGVGVSFSVLQEQKFSGLFPAFMYGLFYTVEKDTAIPHIVSIFCSWYYPQTDVPAELLKCRFGWGYFVPWFCRVISCHNRLLIIER